jgi:hypothetical protein
MRENPLLKLQPFGQSIWMDYIRRHMITSGELKRLIEEDGLLGVTSNPSIFEKAIAGSHDYDETIRASEKKLKDAFGRANQALANHHYLKASEYWVKKEEKKTSHALKSATLHLEHAVVWSGHKFETGETIVIKEIHTVAGKLIEGKKWTSEEVSKGIKNIRNEISKLGKKTEPNNK